METNPQQSLEQLIHRELSKLPPRDAPATLIPRVLAQIQARARKHWWQCPWTYWPWPLKVLSLPLFLSSAVGAIVGLSMVWNLLANRVSLEPVSERFESVSSILDILTSLGNAVLMLGRAAGPQWLLTALLVPLTMYLACVGLGTLCYRVALSYRS